MSSYRPVVPRIAIGVAALLMTATTFAAFVVVPSEIERESLDSTARSAVTSAAAARPGPGAMVRCFNSSAT
jgi:hypothetical protein